GTSPSFASKSLTLLSYRVLSNSVSHSLMSQVTSCDAEPPKRHTSPKRSGILFATRFQKATRGRMRVWGSGLRAWLRGTARRATLTLPSASCCHLTVQSKVIALYCTALFGTLCMGACLRNVHQDACMGYRRQTLLIKPS